MNYNKIYDNLINRAKYRNLKGYKESHHILPKCLSGTDDKLNLVDLTPEEHYIAHLLLIKIYPTEEKLVYASKMMCVGNDNVLRNNKFYGWVKRKFCAIQSKNNSGKNSNNYGKIWITNLEKETKIFKDENIPIGWFKGRLSSKQKNCQTCQKIHYNKSKFCSKSCKPVPIQLNSGSKATKNSQFYTNGYVDIRINNFSIVPNGFYKGRTKGHRRRLVSVKG